MGHYSFSSRCASRGAAIFICTAVPANLHKPIASGFQFILLPLHTNPSSTIPLFSSFFSDAFCRISHLLCPGLNRKPYRPPTHRNTVRCESNVLIPVALRAWIYKDLQLRNRIECFRELQTNHFDVPAGAKTQLHEKHHNNLRCGGRITVRAPLLFHPESEKAEEA